MIRAFLMASSRKGGLPQRPKSTLPGRTGKIQARLLTTGSSPVYKAPENTLVDGVSNLSLNNKKGRILEAKLSVKNKSGRQRPYSSTGGKITSFKSDLDVVKFIKFGQAQKIVVCAGAGISTASGIPDFRTPGSGLYDNLQQYNIPYPEAIFDIDYFHHDPKPFFCLAKELYPSGKYRPNYTHYFMRMLHDKGQLLRIYTQNIDGLERLAGIPPHKLVEAHGTFSTAICTICNQKHEGEEIKDAIFLNKIPKCKRKGCPGVVKPDIVFFGEDLPRRFYLYLKDMLQADLVLVMGTSLEVQPFAGIIDLIRYNVPRILFNMEPVGPFRHRKRAHDFVNTGDLTESVRKFVSRLEWEEEVSELISKCEDQQKCWVGGSNKNNPSSEDQKDSSTQETSSPKGSNHSSSASKGGNLATTINPTDISPPRRHLHTMNSAKSEGQKPNVCFNQRRISSTGRARTALLPRLGGSHKSKEYQWKGYRAQKEDSSSSSTEETSESSSEEDSR
ncbi:NAD-dependent protein deacetylase sirtuin-3-like [Liolophura sinensis]|uniref:NAD-dependent protein deacetylase sirtuin-3-like n=1 Tax=Liolophura sinensis TaxID=3198878 RepID=UPI00315883A7